VSGTDLDHDLIVRGRHGRDDAVHDRRVNEKVLTVPLPGNVAHAESSLQVRSDSKRS
jgi:hypothetical protein